MNAGITEKVEITIREYINLFPGEFLIFKKELQDIKFNLRDEKTASIKGTHVLEREVYRLPETLYTALKGMLSDEEWDEFQSDSGVKSFMKKYPEFRVPKEV